MGAVTPGPRVLRKPGRLTVWCDGVAHIRTFGKDRPIGPGTARSLLPFGLVPSGLPEIVRATWSATPCRCKR